MAKVKITGHASGSGVITVTAPNTSTDRTITLPDATATIATTTDVAARLPSITDGGNATAMTIDSSENIGIGVTPTNFVNRKSLDIGLNGKIWSHVSANETGVGHNFYYDGAYKYISTAAASRNLYDGNGHTFQVAASGSADAAISWTTAMTINTAGIVTTPKVPAFYVHAISNSNSNGGTSGAGYLIFTNASQNGSHYSTSTGKFTAPVAGWYKLQTTFLADDNYSVSGTVAINVNGSIKIRAYFQSTGSRYWSAVASGVVYMNANDYAQANAPVGIHVGAETNFSGHLIG